MRGKDCKYPWFQRRSGITPARAGKRMFCRLDSWPERDHPRACGEKAARPGQVGRQPGSPPRMRGKGPELGHSFRAEGITPAHAGKRAALYFRSALSRDYPRACGEKNGIEFRDSLKLGSPPRMRGKVIVAVFDSLPVGITPAHAGKSDKFKIKETMKGDHPRACGEKSGVRPNQTKCTGSPPRMRGKATVHEWKRGGNRITPAHAGKSKAGTAVRNSNGDHPRACGEKVVFQLFGMVGQGSPPRMRGKGIGTSNVSVGNRITPAYAGKSFPVNLVSRQLQDHPRVCGEKRLPPLEFTGSQGSPPRMRGKASFFRCLCPGDGITPAYAGKRLYSERTDRPRRDHPRVCGEKVSLVLGWFAPLGSPPRMRGKGVDALSGCLSAGITPAYAGKSQSGLRRPGWW